MFVRLFYFFESCRFRKLEVVHFTMYAVVRERIRSFERLAKIVVVRHPEFAPKSGDPCVTVPPVPIPNTEVKRHSSDGSACIACARVGRCQS